MEKKFYIIIGRSGSGKGTQASLLKEYLASNGHTDVKHFTTGGSFREFFASQNHTSKIAKEVADSGGLLPAYLAIWNWANIFIKELGDNTTVLLDGAPRAVDELRALHSAINFYGYSKPTVIHIDVSESWAIDKLTKRGREDDESMKNIREKMNWFEENVLPCVSMYIDDPRYKVVRINGEQTVDEVHAEILSKI